MRRIVSGLAAAGWIVGGCAAAFAWLVLAGLGAQFVGALLRALIGE